MKSLLVGLLSLAVLSTALMAADKKPRYRAGDKVQVEWAGKTETATVVEVQGNGWVKVKFRRDGIELTPALPPNQLKPLAKKNAPSKAGQPAGEADKPGAELRTWTDKKGKYKLKARFVELVDGQVTLEKENGTTVQIGLDKLSDEDQKLARKLAEDLADEADENPFGPKDNDGGDQPQADEADWSQVEQVVVEDPGKWSLTPDATPALTQPLATRPVTLNTDEPIDAFDKVDGLLFDRAGKQAFVVTIDSPPAGEKAVRVARVDLVEGKSHQPLALPEAVKPVDVDPSGKRLLARTDFFVNGNAPPEVSVWELGERAIKHVRTWSAHDPDNFHKTAPSQARFIDADHVLTLAFPGRLAVWEVAHAKALYRMELSNNGVAALSAGGKYLAAPVNNGLYVFDALSGKILGKLPGDPGIVTALSFRPDGRQLAAASPQRLMVWDLERGELYRDIYFPTALAAAQLDWLSAGYLLLEGERLVDLERRIVLWQYQHEAGRGLEHGYGEKGGLFWFVLPGQSRSQRGLFHTKLPHDEALKVAATLKADELLAVKPGAKVSLSVAVPNDPQGVTQALSGQLAQLGMNVVNGSLLVLEASTAAGQSRQIAYRSFGPGRGVEQANVTEQIARVRFVENGKVIWEGVSITGAPHMLQIKQGETLQQALAQYQQPNVQFFSQVKLPQFVARPNEQGAYGASTLTAQGIQTAQVRLAKPGGGP